MELATLEKQVANNTDAANMPKAAAGQEAALENWLRGHIRLIAVVIVAAGFVLRFIAAQGTYLNPDEALHYQLSNQSSMLAAYKAGLTNAHPPLLYLVEYFWRVLGRSEIVLRTPLVIAGTLSCWFYFRWMEEVFDAATAVVGLMLFTFAPAVIDVSAELRQYALLLLFAMASLYFLARAFTTQSVRLMWCFSVSLYLCILSHYSAMFFAAAAAIYALIRVAGGAIERKVAISWVAGQGGAAGLYSFLYVAHIQKLQGRSAEWGSSFVRNYFYWKYDDAWLFLREHTLEICRYLFNDEHAASAVLLAFVAGSALLFAQGVFPPQGKGRSFDRAVLIVAPFLLIFGAAALKRYPYVGNRHTIVLAPFLIAGSSVIVAFAVRRRVWVGLLVALATACVSLSAPDPSTVKITRQNQRAGLMKAAVLHIEASVAPDDVIFIDAQTSLVLPYYLCGKKEATEPVARGKFNDIPCRGFRIAATNFETWKLTASNFAGLFREMSQVYDLKDGKRVWVVQMGWGLPLAKTLPEKESEFRRLRPDFFGDNIAVFAVDVKRDAAAVPASEALAPGCPQGAAEPNRVRQQAAR